MNKTLWKLQILGERLWILANLTAQQAATLEIEGRGLAVVADETRKLAGRIEALVEKALFEDDEIEAGDVQDVALMLNLLALNNAFESYRIGSRGKPAAVCADDIRQLAYEVALLLPGNSSPKNYQTVMPFPKDLLTSIDEDREFLLLNIAGINVVEPMSNIKEVCMTTDYTKTHIKLRGMEIPLVDSCKLLGKPKEESAFVILQTPWATQNKTYAVAANILGIFRSPIGKPTTQPIDMPLSEYLRECWDSENEAKFYFMDWSKML